MKLRIATGRLSVIILISCVFSFAPRAVGQVSDQASEEDRLEMEAFLEREREMARDPSAYRRPPPPDDPNEEDVAKRKRFLWELGRHRLDFGCFHSLNLLKAATDDISEATREDLLERWLPMVAEQLRPADVEHVRWYAQWGTYASPDAPEGIMRRMDLYVAEWSVDGFVVRASQLADSGRYVRILFRCPKRPTLKFRRMPADFDQHSADWYHVSKKGLQAALVDFSGMSYAADASFRPRGTVDTCAGVDVFTWKVQSRQKAWSKIDENAGDTNGSPIVGVPDRILITDSDPQYVCISFDLKQTPQEED